MEDRPTRELDATSLKALAHPLRVRILDALDILGRANSTALARRLGESTGSTSYHLRELARHGLIVEDDTPGVGRERWWKVAPGGFTLKGSDYLAGDDTRSAARLLIGDIHGGRAKRLQRWLDTIEEWPLEWKQASIEVEYQFRLTAVDLGECVSELQRVLDRYRALHESDEAAAEPVAVQLNAFPQSLEKPP
ncbi:MAG: ArsR/SmtB family transcription factor [Actinomycetota bacterium]